MSGTSGRSDSVSHMRCMFCLEQGKCREGVGTLHNWSNVSVVHTADEVAACLQIDVLLEQPGYGRSWLVVSSVASVQRSEVGRRVVARGRPVGGVLVD